MLEHIRSNSTQDGQQKCHIFEDELEMARKDLKGVSIKSADIDDSQEERLKVTVGKNFYIPLKKNKNLLNTKTPNIIDRK